MTKTLKFEHFRSKMKQKQQLKCVFDLFKQSLSLQTTIKIEREDTRAGGREGDAGGELEHATMSECDREGGKEREGKADLFGVRVEVGYQTKGSHV